MPLKSEVKKDEVCLFLNSEIKFHYILSRNYFISFLFLELRNSQQILNSQTRHSDVVFNVSSNGLTVSKLENFLEL